MGILYTEFETKYPKLADLTLLEAISRVCKNKIRKDMRDTLIRVKTTVESPFRELLVDELNSILNGKRIPPEKTIFYWEEYIPKELNLFRFTEKMIPKDLRKRVSEIFVCKSGRSEVSGRFYLLQRIMEMTGLKLSDYRLKELSLENSFGTEQYQVISLIDIIDIGVRVKDMNIMSEAKLYQNLHNLIQDGRQQSDSEDSLRRYKRKTFFYFTFIFYFISYFLIKSCIGNFKNNCSSLQRTHC